MTSECNLLYVEPIGAALVIDADGHVEESLAHLVGRIPVAMRNVAMEFEWRCRQAWHLLAVGEGRPMQAEVAANYGEFFNHHPFTGLFAAMARRQLRRDPEILT